jgi:membrane associated rhomboid family serine protease
MTNVLFMLVVNAFISLVSFLPLRDARGPGKRFPVATWSIVAVNAGVHVVMHYLAPRWLPGEAAWDSLMHSLMLTPSAVLEGQGLGAASMVTSAFLHADGWHIFGNMLFLVFFGRKVEDLLGPGKFMLFYLVSVFVSGIGSVLVESMLPVTQGQIPGLGASGAVTAVMGAYLFLYHEQRLRTLMLVAILPVPIPVKLPVWFFVLYHTSKDIIGGYLEQSLQELGYRYSMVGFFAHLSGFIAGMTLIYLFLPAELIHYRHRPLGERSAGGVVDRAEVVADSKVVG